MGGDTSGLFSGTQGSEKLDFNGQREATAFLSQDKLEEHYERHKKDFGDITDDQYIEKAKEFFSAEIGDTIRYFYDVDGVLYKYDKKRIVFGMCRADGAIITFYRPYDGDYKKGLKYWERKVLENAI